MTISFPALERDVIELLNEITSDWDTGFGGRIGPATKLVADLDFQSIDVVQLMVAIEEHFGKTGLPVRELLMTAEGAYVADLCVEQLVVFLYRHLNSSDVTPT